MRKHISWILAAALAVSALTACGSSGGGAAPAQEKAGGAEKATDAQGGTEWPKKDIQIICPFAAGGDTDFSARTFAQYLTDELGVKVVVVNTDGNGGATGARAAKDASNDGYSMLFGSSAFLTNQLSGAVDFGFDAFEFCAVAGKGAGNVICVNKSLGVSTFEELVAYSKEHPGTLKLTANTGATTQAVALMIKDAGVDANIVDSGGSSDRIAGLLGGQVDIIINPYGNVKDYIASGDFVALGLDTDLVNERMKDAGIPTCKEQGFDVVFPSYYFAAFPKGTDPEIVKKMSEAIGNIVASNEEFAEAVGKAYYQVPEYHDTEEGLKLMEDSLASLQKFGDAFKVN